MSLKWSSGKANADTHISSTIEEVTRKLLKAATIYRKNTNSGFLFIAVDSNVFLVGGYSQKAMGVLNQCFFTRL